MGNFFFFHKGKTIWQTIYGNEGSTSKLRKLLNGMAEFNRENFRIFADSVDLSDCNTLCDVGGSVALLSITVAKVLNERTSITYWPRSVILILDASILIFLEHNHLH